MHDRIVRTVGPDTFRHIKSLAMVEFYNQEMVK